MESVGIETRTPLPRLWVLAAGGLVLVVAWVVLAPAVGYDYIGYDDQDHILLNPYTRSLAPGNVWRMFTRPAIDSYYGFRTLSLAIDYAVWGLRPMGYHLTNLLLHSASLLMLFALGLRLGRRVAKDGRWGVVASAAGALVLAAHPLMVEPVVWTGAREESLMLAGVLAAVHLHLTARDRTRAGRRWAAVGYHAATGLAAAVACFSSVLGVAVAVILTAWDLLVRPRPRWTEAVGGLAPVWGLAALQVALKVSRMTVGLTGPGRFQAAKRPLVVLAAYAQNWATILWPREMSILYPWDIPHRWGDPWVVWGLVAAGLTAAALGVAVWRGRRRVLFGLLWFLVALAPSSHLINHHIFRSDRLLYLPMAGLGVAAAMLLAGLKRPSARAVAAGGAVVAGALLAWGAVSYRSLWRRPVLLYQHCLGVYPNSTALLNNMGAAYHYEGNFAKARSLYERSMAVEPLNVAAMANLAGHRKDQGRLEEAVRLYKRALGAAPYMVKVHYELALLLAEMGRHEEAVHHYRQVLNAFSLYHGLHYNLANSLLKLRRHDEALHHYRQAIKLQPRDLEVRTNYAYALREAGRHEEALEVYNWIVEAAPRDGGARVDRAWALVALGRRAEAAEDARRALDLRPRTPRTLFSLAALAQLLGLEPEAAAALEQVLSQDPEHPLARQRLAWLLATSRDPAVRDPARALALAQSVAEGPAADNPVVLTTLAEALAANDRYQEAVLAVSTALAAAREAGAQGAISDLEARLARFRSHLAP